MRLIAYKRTCRRVLQAAEKKKEKGKNNTERQLALLI